MKGDRKMTDKDVKERLTDTLYLLKQAEKELAKGR